jgi:hypothetical protein
MNYIFLMTVINGGQDLFNDLSCITFTKILFFSYFVKEFTSWAEPIIFIKNKIKKCLTYSVTKKNLLESWKNSYNLRMLGWSRVFRILISPTSLSRSSYARCFLFIILTARKALDSLCKHFLTSPNEPK